MALTMCEIIWLKKLLIDLGLTHIPAIKLHYDNQDALDIIANPVYHKRVKHINIDCNFIRDQVHTQGITPTYISSKHQVVDLFTKTLPIKQQGFLLRKLRRGCLLSA